MGYACRVVVVAKNMTCKGVSAWRVNVPRAAARRASYHTSRRYSVQ